MLKTWSKTCHKFAVIHMIFLRLLTPKLRKLKIKQWARPRNDVRLKRAK